MLSIYWIGQKFCSGVLRWYGETEWTFWPTHYIYHMSCELHFFNIKTWFVPTCWVTVYLLKLKDSLLCKDNGYCSETAAAKSLQSCPTLCNPIDNGSPPGSSIPGILQARTLEWVAISFSNCSEETSSICWVFLSKFWQAGAFPLSHLGSPQLCRPSWNALEQKRWSGT